jgi:uncharacterized protein (TIGR00369 family)
MTNMGNEADQYRSKLLSMSEIELNQAASFELARAFGIKWVELTLERVTATMLVEPFHHQPFGYMHGGVSLVLAETVSGMGGFLNAPPGTAAFGVEINANHLRPVQAGTMHAVSTPLLVGRTSQVWEVKIWDEQERLVCASRCTMANVDLNQMGA